MYDDGSDIKPRHRAFFPFDKNDISVINGKFTFGDDELTTKDMIIIVLRDEDDKIETLYILGRNEKDRNFVVEV